MKYTVSNIINRPLDEVVTKFKDPEAIKHWMEGIQEVENVSGVPGEVGFKRNLHFLNKNRKMVISETVLENNPNQMKFAYDSKMGKNVVEIKFEKIDENSVTQYNTTDMQMTGIMKVMSFFMKGMFKKYSLKLNHAFKTYAEK